MSLFPAIEVFLAEQGRKYNSPDQAGGLREMMLDLKAKGEAACQEFANFSVSLEVSFIKRKNDDQSLAKQKRVLTVLIKMPTYYFAQIDGVSQGLDRIEEKRNIWFGK